MAFYTKNWLKFFCFYIFFFLFVENAFSFSNQNQTLAFDSLDRRTEQGIVRGFASKLNTITWQGIPFARPPTGDLRWRAPQAPTNRNDILIANNNDTICLQRSGSLITFGLVTWRYMIGSEDCLYLNIVTPDDIKAGEKLPVMVWLHGGGRSKGDKGDQDYAGEHFVQQGRVILVNVNHRIGPFGWFLHPALVNTTDSLAEKSGNFGTLDIIESLRWIRANIDNFGGDQNNIILSGISTGASNTLSLVLSPQAKGLFEKAIVQSGVYRPVSQQFASLPESEGGHHNSSSEIVAKVLMHNNQASNQKEALSLQKTFDQQALADMLRHFDANTLMSFYTETETLAGMLDFPSLNRDGFIIPFEKAEELFEDKENFNSMPIILGSNRDENKIFMAFDLNYVSIPFGIRDKQKYNRHAQYYSDNWKLNSVDKIARPLSKTQENVYAYRFDWDELPKIGWINFSELIGAGHILETPFLFTKQHKRKRKELSDSMIAYWSNFAYTGSPNMSRKSLEKQSLPHWHSWQPEQGAHKFIILDAGENAIRMSNEELFEEEFKQRLKNDSSIVDLQERCYLYRTMFIPQDISTYDFSEYTSLGCAESVSKP